jgi:DNA-binding NarL/FixJ family response regulator
MLNDLTGSISAAFARHNALMVDPRPADMRRMPALPVRERKVCELLLLGCSTEAIALRLIISPHTVKDHRKSIFRKLCISSLAELFARISHPSSGGLARM